MAERIGASLPDCHVLDSGPAVGKTIAEAWQLYEGIICVMATGIVIRSIVSLLRDKALDPCVVVVDQQGRHAISLLSGHLGGGNELAVKVAKICGGQPVITTASDITGRTPLDLWARRNDLIVSDRSRLTEKSAKLVNGTFLYIYSQLSIEKLPDDLVTCDNPRQADIIISCIKDMTYPGLCCIPRVLYLGIGCNRGTACVDIERAFAEICDDHAIEPLAFAGIATIDVKHDEPGILQFAKHHNLDISYFSRDQLNGVENVAYSVAAMKAVGAKGVAEPSALLAAGCDGSAATLLVGKRKWPDVTMAVAQRMRTQWD